MDILKYVCNFFLKLEAISTKLNWLENSNTSKHVHNQI